MKILSNYCKTKYLKSNNLLTIDSKSIISKVDKNDFKFMKNTQSITKYIFIKSLNIIINNQWSDYYENDKTKYFTNETKNIKKLIQLYIYIYINKSKCVLWKYYLIVGKKTIFFIQNILIK